MRKHLSLLTLADVVPRLPPQLVAKRPVSPHVFEIDGRQPHYKFPIGAISSIANRATGVALSVGEQGRLCSLGVLTYRRKLYCRRTRHP